MKQIDPYETYQQVVNEHYAGLDNPAAGPWPLGIIKLACWQAGFSTNATERMGQIAGNALSTLSADQRAAFTEKYAIPGNVLAVMQSPVAWPDALPVEELEERTDEDMGRTRAQAVVALSLYAETQTQRVIPGGLYSSMTYMQKQLEATGLLSALEDGDTPEEGEYPLLESEKQFYGDSLEAVATIILQKASAWTLASAAINTILQDAQARLRTAEDTEQVDGILAAAKDGIRAVADALLAAPGAGEGDDELVAEDAGDDMEEVPEGEEGAFDPAITDDAHEQPTGNDTPAAT